MPARPSRRTVVSAALAAPVSAVAFGAAGCTLSGPAAEPPSATPTPEEDPDVALLDEVVDQTEAMVTLYERAIEQHRDLARELRPLLAAHREHASALGDAAPGTGPTRPSEKSSQLSDDVSRRPGAALRDLRSAERQCSDQLLEYTRRAVSGPFARLLASMSACSAQHVYALTGVSA